MKTHERAPPVYTTFVSNDIPLYNILYGGMRFKHVLHTLSMTRQRSAPGNKQRDKKVALAGSFLPQTALESILHVVYAELVLACEYPHDVESQGVEVRVLFGKVLLGEGTEGPLFAGGDGFQRVAEAGSAPQFHFDEDEDVVLAQDQIDLPVTRPVVAFDELVASPGQIPQREVLTPLSGGLLFQSPTPA
jgi:hypothetical protein